MNFLNLPFGYRLLLVLLFLSSISMLDLHRHRQAATRWKESLFLLTVGVIGSLYALLVDLCTSSLSKHYFLIGKGIAADHSFLSNVLLQGIEAGLIGGLLGACCLVYANNPKPDKASLSYRRLYLELWKPLLCATLVGCIIGAMIYKVFPIGRFSFYKGVISEADALLFVTVWSIHGGIYVGGIVGFVWGAIRIHRLR